MSPYIPRTRAARSVELIRVTVAEGAGTEDSLVRLVDYYFDEMGKCVAVTDPENPHPWGASLGLPFPKPKYPDAEDQP